MLHALGHLIHAYTVGSFMLAKQLGTNGSIYRGYRLYYKGMRAGIQIGIQIEKERQIALQTDQTDLD